MLLNSFYINYEKVFELVLIGDNTNTKKIQCCRQNTKQYSTFLKNFDVIKNCKSDINILQIFLDYLSYLISLPSFKYLGFSLVLYMKSSLREKLLPLSFFVHFYFVLLVDFGLISIFMCSRFFSKKKLKLSE